MAKDTEFCCNPLCRCHIKCPVGVVNAMSYVEANSQVVEVARKKIIDAERKKEFDFCEICANAVALVNQ